MLDHRTALIVRDLLLKAAKLIDASVKATGVVCTHDNYTQLTTMDAKKHSYLCGDCEYTWTEEFDDEEIRTFQGREGGEKTSITFDS